MQYLLYSFLLLLSYFLTPWGKHSVVGQLSVSSHVWLEQGATESVIVCNAFGPPWSRSGQPGHKPLSSSLALLSSSHLLAVHSCWWLWVLGYEYSSCLGRHVQFCRLSTAQKCPAEGTRKGSNKICIPHAKPWAPVWGYVSSKGGGNLFLTPHKTLSGLPAGVPCHWHLSELRS